MASGLRDQNDKELPISFYHEVFDSLGYSKTLAEKRIQINQNYAAGLTQVTNRNWTEEVQVLVAGSRGEGIAISLGSDIDMIFVQRAVKCFQNINDTNNAGDVATFQIDLSNSPEGYAKLRLISIKERSDLKGPNNYWRVQYMVNEALVEENGSKYLRNDHKLVSAIEYGAKSFKRQGWLSNQYEFSQTSGPAQPIRIPIPLDGMFLNVDFVPAFPCVYQSPLDAWQKRARSQKWPTKEDISAVMEAEIFVVPAGEPGSDDVLSWRISFTLAERYLVHSFSDTQIKVYAALKMLAKHYLKPKCSAITSYVVKNILFWVFEKSPDLSLGPGPSVGPGEKCPGPPVGPDGEEFVELLLQGLSYMKDCVNRDNLENYMIPSRNMLKDRMKETEKTDLLQYLDSLIQEGPRALLCCPLLKEVDKTDSLEDDGRLIFRELTDEVLLSLQSLPPDDFDKTERLLHRAQSKEEFMDVFTHQVFPVIRKSNPFRYFKRLNSMEAHEVWSRFKEGVEKNWQMWTGYSRSTES